MAWYDGMTEAEITEAIRGDKAPTWNGMIEVPQWYQKLAGAYEDRNQRLVSSTEMLNGVLETVLAESYRSPLRESIALNLERMADHIEDVNGKRVHESDALRAAARRVRAKEWDK